MPVNFIQLRQQITQMGTHAQAYFAQHRSLLKRASTQLYAYGARGQELCALVDKAVQANARLRCAVPTQADILQGIDTLPCAPAGMVLAADGSQINPSRHDPFPIGVINVGAYRSIAGSIPQEIQETRLLYFDEVTSGGGLLTEGMIALRRDLEERRIMARLAKDQPQPVITLTDGPLELFFDQRESQEFQRALQDYLESLRELETMRVVTAGYVDRPMSDLVVRLLELTLLADENLSQSDRKRPLAGICDEELFRDLLKPGQRSAVFAIQSQQTQPFSGGLRLHFFYLNVGRAGRPALARVELPAWAAYDEVLLNLLQHTLIQECGRMGTDYYPYCLLRAHEVALVGMQEKEKIYELIGQEYLNRGMPLETYSFKQTGKNLLGRNRYSRKR